MASQSEVSARLTADSSQYQSVMTGAVGIANQTGAAIAGAFSKTNAQLFASLDQLIAIQQKRQIASVAGYNQDIILQREILGLKQSIDNIEGTTIAKLQMQIQLEQKQLQLETMIAGIRAKGAADMGGPVRGFASEAAAATTKAGGLFSGFSRLASMAGILKGAFSSLIGITSAMFAPAVADKLARMITGFSKAEEDALNVTVELSGKAADKQEENLKRVTASHQAAAEERAQSEEKQYEMLVAFRAKSREEEIAAEKKYRQSLYDAQQDSDQEHLRSVKENLEMLTLEAKSVAGLTAAESKRLQVLKLIAQQRTNEAEIVSLLTLPATMKVGTEENKRLQYLLSQNDAIRTQIGLITNPPIPDKPPIIKQIESYIDAWDKFVLKVTTSGKGDKELTDAELARKVANIQKDIFARNTANATAAGGAYYNPSTQGADGLLEAQKSNLRQTKAEIDLRRRVRGQVSAFGVGYAFNQNPGISEERFREIIQGIDTSTQGQIATELEKLNKQLSKGVQTVFTGTT